MGRLEKQAKAVARLAIAGWLLGSFLFSALASSSTCLHELIHAEPSAPHHCLASTLADGNGELAPNCTLHLAPPSENVAAVYVRNFAPSPTAFSTAPRGPPVLS